MTQVIDPVCGKALDSETAQHKTEYQGKSYYFCCPGCKRAFEREPEMYLSGSGGGHHGHMGGKGKMKGMKKGGMGGMKHSGGMKHGGMEHDEPGEPAPDANANTSEPA